MSVRNKRLQNDFDNLSELVKTSGNTLALISTQGNPPFHYVVEYRCKGIESVHKNEPIFRNTHRVEITLVNNYPKSRPDAKFLTPIFHPDVYPNGSICLGNWEEMAETLPELVLRIGKIIQYAQDIINQRGYDNHDAWIWYNNNKHRLPVDNQTFKFNASALGMSWDDLPVTNNDVANTPNIVFLDL